MRTLDDIVPPSRRKETPETQEEIRAMNAPLRPRRTRSGFPYTTAIIALVIILLAAGAIWYYSGAEVEVTPNADAVTASGSYTATATGTDLSFRIVTADKVATQSVAATGSQNVSSVAVGTIIISNSSSATQKLVATTRFETTSGLVFHIKNAASIPAGGSVSAAVYADQPGATYNIGASSFTVPGLANSALYSEVIGKSTSSMSGGASGSQPVVDPTTLASAQAALQTALAPDLASQLQAAVPEGYVLIAGAASTTYQSLAPTMASSTGMATVSEEGTATGIALPDAALAQALALQVEGSAYSGQALTIADPTTLALTPSAGLPDASSQTFTFTLSGSANLISTIDPNQIAAAVAGKTRSAAEVALTNYPSVKQAVLILRPFWESTFPEDPAKITVVVEPAAQ
jgi:hypothetical protein